MKTKGWELREVERNYAVKLRIWDDKETVQTLRKEDQRYEEKPNNQIERTRRRRKMEPQTKTKTNIFDLEVNGKIEENWRSGNDSLCVKRCWEISSTHQLAIQRERNSPNFKYFGLLTKSPFKKNVKQFFFFLFFLVFVFDMNR